MKKQIIAGITATLTVAGNAVTLVHAENEADNTAPISQETESPLSTEQQQALAEATTAETKLNDAKTQATTAEENTKQADKTVTETVQKHTDAMRNTAIADEAALKDVKAKKEEAIKAQQELDKADKAFDDATNAYKEAESKSIDAVAAFKSAKTALDLANKHADEVTDAKVKEAADAKKNADDALTKAQTDYKNAQDAVTKAQSSSDTAKTNADNAKAKATAANNEVTKAQKAVDEATAKVTEAQKKADEFKSEDALNDAIKQAQTDLDNAKAEQTKAEADLTAKQNAQKDASKTLANANTALDTANQALTTAQNQLKTAQTNLDNANKAKTDAQTVLDKANADKKTAETAQTTAQKAYDDAVKANADAAKAYEQAQAQIVAQQKIVDAAKVKADNAQAQYEKGFKGFLEEMKLRATDEKTKTTIDKALEMLTGKVGTIKFTLNEKTGLYEAHSDEHGNFETTTQIEGKEITEYLAQYDKLHTAQNLDNAMASIAGLERTNELRKQNGLPALDTNYALIAESMVKSDIAFIISGHPVYSVYSSSENLAWGSTTSSDAVDLFYNEKKEFDNFKLDADDTNTKEYYKNNSIEFQKKYTEESFKTGHYLNIVNPKRKQVAMSLSPEGLGLYPRWEQAFSDNASDMLGTVDLATMTIAEYKQQLQSYIDSLKNAPEIYKKELAKLNDMKSKLAVVSDKDVTAAKDKLDAANQAVKNAETAVTNAQTTLNQANKDVAQAQKGVTDNQSAVTSKQADVKTAQNAVNQAQEAKTAADNAVKTAKTALDNAQVKVTNAQTALDAKKTALNNFNVNKAQAEKEFTDAKTALAKANTDKANADNALADALKAQQDADNKLKEATDKLNEAKTHEADKKAAYDKASKDATAASNQITTLNGYKNAIASAKDNLNKKQADVEKTEQVLSDAKKAAEDKKAEVDTAKTKADNAKAAYTQAQQDYKNAKDGKPSAYKDLAEAVNAEAKAQKEAEIAQADYEEAEKALTKAKDDEAKAQEAFNKALDALAGTIETEEKTTDSAVIDDQNVDLSVKGFKEAVEALLNKQEFYNGLKDGKNTKFTHIYDKDADADSIAKLKAYASVKGFTPVDFFDLGVAIDNDGTVTPVKEVPAYVTYSFDVQDVKGRQYHVSRLHDGSIEELPFTYDKGHIVFTNNKYSAFMVSYTDAPVQVVNGDADNKTGGQTVQADNRKTTPATKTATTAKTSNAKATTKQAKKTQRPETSDPTEMAGWMMALIASAGAAFVTAKMKKED